MTERDFDTLELFFDAARHRAEDPSADLMQRVLDDALAEQRLQQSAPAPMPVARSGLLRQFLAAIGGWPAVAGLATASVTGLWIGVNPPAAVTDTAESYLSSGADSYLVDMMPGFQFDLAEG
ncbi:hypothetical protein TG4357_02002 [Thalassovita gelatinovora]|uniref:Dihydroorotate dehydrogenase n=1 Tax=Thalassovita gelatinovora TaxID=53501 RepID=A0A0P1FBX7_THAGE|nr:hypothetical protein [Thalassovita gelatinovora]QIZ80008.1 hypothetical protein HFZ77_05685 [Thalassovita gelatinovora]CUH65687.1 hypothetical protein TG4357_02002 [Thalassovita gelatinovora]SER04973.1 hypothetical protein SAMN04488043_11451 [Thalassovita gelatinovora]